MEKPAWVGKLAFYPQFPADNTYSYIGTMKNIYLLKNDATKHLLRFERHESGNTTTMSANFFLVTILGPQEQDAVEALREQLRRDEDVEIWVEEGNSSLQALHFSKCEELETFQKVLDLAQQFGLKPFPDYQM